MGVDPARVPPGQYLTAKFPVLTVGGTPAFDLDTWTLAVDGEVERPYTLSWDELMALPQREVTVDIHCVTRWSKLDTQWRGVAVSDLLERAGVRPAGSHLMAHSDGGYTTNLPLEAVRDPRSSLRTPSPASRSSAITAPRCGCSCRERYFWKSAKFLRRLEVMRGDRMGFWELGGYHNDADPWQEQRHWF